MTVKKVMSDPFPSPFAPEVQDDPFPCYRWLREERPVYRCTDPDCWMLSRYADVVAAARDHAAYSSALGIGPRKVPGQTMITSDPPNHTRLRRLVSRAFQSGVIEALAPRIEKICHELIDASARERNSFDLMEDFAIPLPIRVIAELLGLDPDRYPDYRRWTQALVEHVGRPDDPEVQRLQAKTAREFFSYLYQVGRSRLRAPKNDLVSLLIQACLERDALNPVEVAYACELFLIAGAETTTALIGNAALALHANPGQAAQVADNPALIPPMIEEAIRFDSPIHCDFRTTTRAVSVRGVEIPSGAKVALLFGAANRDPEIFEAPDEFRVARTPNPHIGFGYGIHYCLGAPLARLEARIAAIVLRKRFQSLEPDPVSRPTRNYSSPMIRGVLRLPMSFILQ